MSTKPKILIVEDDDLQYEIYEDALAEYELIRATSGTQALELLGRNPPSLLILDHILSAGERGLDFLPEFKELAPFIPIIVVSGALEVHEQFQALQGPRRAHYCLPKPVDIRELSRTVATALKECGETEVVRQFEALERSRRVDALELFSRSTDRLSRQKRMAGAGRQIGGAPQYFRARPRIPRGPAHDHPRFAGIDPAGGTAPISVPGMGEPERGRLEKASARRR